MTRLILSAAALIALASWVGSSWAQTVYKSTMPDGRVIYSTEPVRGAKRVETLKPPAESTGVPEGFVNPLLAGATAPAEGQEAVANGIAEPGAEKAAQDQEGDESRAQAEPDLHGGSRAVTRSCA